MSKLRLLYCSLHSNPHQLSWILTFLKADQHEQRKAVSTVPLLPPPEKYRRKFKESPNNEPAPPTFLSRENIVKNYSCTTKKIIPRQKMLPFQEGGAFRITILKQSGTSSQSTQQKKSHNLLMPFSNPFFSCPQLLSQISSTISVFST